MARCFHHRRRNPPRDHPLVPPGRSGQAQVVAHEDDDPSSSSRPLSWLGFHPKGLPSPDSGPLGRRRHALPSEMMFLAQHHVRARPSKVFLQRLPSRRVGRLNGQGEALLSRGAVDVTVQALPARVCPPCSLETISTRRAVSEGGSLAVRRTARGVGRPRVIGLAVSDSPRCPWRVVLPHQRTARERP